MCYHLNIGTEISTKYLNFKTLVFWFQRCLPRSIEVDNFFNLNLTQIKASLRNLNCFVIQLNTQENINSDVATWRIRICLAHFFVANYWHFEKNRRSNENLCNLLFYVAINRISVDTYGMKSTCGVCRYFRFNFLHFADSCFLYTDTLYVFPLSLSTTTKLYAICYSYGYLVNEKKRI